MKDTIATVTIINSLREIVNELKAMREELHQLNRFNSRGGAAVRHELSALYDMDDPFGKQ